MRATARRVRGWIALTALAALLVHAPSASANIVADSGLRPNPDGFSFENYGFGYADLNAAQMQRIYGRRVCMSGKGEKCVLRPVMRFLVMASNLALGGGHCYGIAILSEAIYQRHLLPRLGFTSLTQLGAPGPDSTTFEIPLEGNVRLQRAIARAWFYQTLPSVKRAVVKGRPSQVLDRLIEELQKGKDNPEAWTLAVWAPEGTGGHAITPYAVEEVGDGTYKIWVYDNNYPDDDTRYVTVDTNADRWEYEIAPGEVWYGDAQIKGLELHPLTPALGIQPCPYCQGRGGRGSRFNEITLDAPGADHAHLILRDKRGRRTGIIDGKLVNQIPGVRVVRRSGVTITANGDGEPEATGVEPVYRVPKNRWLRITVDGRHLEESEDQALTVIGPALDATMRRIDLDPGERASFLFNPKRKRLRYAPARTSEEAAVTFGAEARDRRKPKKRYAAYEITITARGVPEGARFEYRRRAGRLEFGHALKRRARVRYHVNIEWLYSKASRFRRVARTYTLGGRKRHAYLNLKVLRRHLAKPRIVVVSDGGKRLPGKPAKPINA